jgi:glyoxylase-like metal-dependent hydrolase (beta-lactamase superfamily II)
MIHRLELASQPESERVIDGFEPVQVAPEFLAIPTPGHTRGHTALLYRDQFLFTGDHMWWSREKTRLSASRSVCWYSWPEQVTSLRKLQQFSFEWVLPGHGQRIWLPLDEMRKQLRLLGGEDRSLAVAAQKIGAAKF